MRHCHRTGFIRARSFLPHEFMQKSSIIIQLHTIPRWWQVTCFCQNGRSDKDCTSLPPVLTELLRPDYRRGSCGWLHRRSGAAGGADAAATGAGPSDGVARAACQRSCSQLVPQAILASPDGLMGCTGLSPTTVEGIPSPHRKDDP